MSRMINFLKSCDFFALVTVSFNLVTDLEDACKSHCSEIFVIFPIKFSTAVYILEYYLKYLSINKVIRTAYSPWNFAHLFSALFGH